MHQIGGIPDFTRSTRKPNLTREQVKPSVQGPMSRPNGRARWTSSELRFDQGTSFETWYERGDELAQQGQYEAALVCFDQALMIRPDSQDALVFRATMLLHLKCYEDALTSCELAIALNPNHVEAWIFRGAALHYLGCYRESYASYDQALLLDSELN